MRFTRLLTILLLMSQLAVGQEIAITERGDSVYLFSNGTWDYYDNYLYSNNGSIEIEHAELFVNYN